MKQSEMAAATNQVLTSTTISNIMVNIINKSKNPLPKYETLAASGMDLRANINEKIFLVPGRRILIPTGIFLELPLGLEGQVRPRSGLAFKHGITVLNTPGTIDSDYRGEIGVILINHGSETFEINNGDKIAQLVICSYVQIDLKEVNELSSSERGEGGFGHTGIK